MPDAEVPGSIDAPGAARAGVVGSAAQVMMPAHNPADTVREALTRVTSILLDMDDQLADATGEQPHPRGWAAALDDFHTVLVELADLATVTSGHYDRWARANPAADHAERAGVAEAVEALSRAWDALTSAIEAVGTARDSSIHRPEALRRGRT